METITKTPEQMSESFAQPDVQERFTDWAERAIASAKKDAKEEKVGPREISLKNRPDAEREFIEAVAQKDETAKESRRDSSAEKEATAGTEQRPKAPVEPMAADRYWQSRSDGKMIEAKELEKHWQSVDSRAGVALQYINSHPQKDQIEQGLKAFFAGKPKAWQDAISPDLYTALAEVASPGEVLRHIAMQPEDREVLRKVKNWQELRAAIRTISQHYPAAKSQAQASPKPRAPRPPSEVGGRGAAGDDSTRNAENWSSFSESMNRRYAR